MTAPSDDERFLMALEQVHAFPCRYTFKVIGDYTPDFQAQALEVVGFVVPDAVPETSARLSSGGTAQSVTVVVEVPSAQVVVAIHKALGRLPGAKVGL
jgi:putative lipoic acid-binding regulatory protein